MASWSQGKGSGMRNRGAMEMPSIRPGGTIRWCIWVGPSNDHGQGCVVNFAVASWCSLSQSRGTSLRTVKFCLQSWPRPLRSLLTNISSRSYWRQLAPTELDRNELSADADGEPDRRTAQAGTLFGMLSQRSRRE